MCELRRYGRTYIETVSRLELDWIKENVDDRIGSHVVLHQAINHTWTRTLNNQTHKEYGREHSIGVSVLKQYSTYFNKVESLANEAHQIGD